MAADVYSNCNRYRYSLRLKESSALNWLGHWPMGNMWPRDRQPMYMETTTSLTLILLRQWEIGYTDTLRIWACNVGIHKKKGGGGGGGSGYNKKKLAVI